ncbi:hypothetical protein T4D_4550 [Trichinella pseudospiralis]|uniref:Uncharacterized protein n=1 Tax=Trichinella pseudospiralis TaxID=6337 RepID=A0A0V1EBC4_TRIPS|nr:hypothetical protein T4D_4550 [Trichinella pseudospiralis]
MTVSICREDIETQNFILSHWLSLSRFLSFHLACTSSPLSCELIKKNQYAFGNTLQYCVFHDILQKSHWS